MMAEQAIVRGPDGLVIACGGAAGALRPRPRTIRPADRTGRGRAERLGRDDDHLRPAARTSGTPPLARMARRDRRRESLRVPRDVPHLFRSHTDGVAAWATPTTRRRTVAHQRTDGGRHRSPGGCREPKPLQPRLPWPVRPLPRAVALARLQRVVESWQRGRCFHDVPPVEAPAVRTGCPLGAWDRSARTSGTRR